MRASRLLASSLCLVVLTNVCPALVVVEGKAPKAVVVVDVGPLTKAQQLEVDETRQWLVDSLKAASGAVLPVAEKVAAGRTIVLATAATQPELARKLKLRTDRVEAYAIETSADRVTLLGANVYALRHAVAHVLRDLGFRYYAPSPKWHIVPALADVNININTSEAPEIGARKIWYAYGQPDKDLKANYDTWAMGNRLSSVSLINTGHSYGNIIGRNEDELAKHPEYYALLEDGERDNKRAVAARKFCFSNPGLMDLCARDRIRLLEEQRKLNPMAYMVSMDPSDGQGTCHCEKCKALGTTTDRVFHLANHVAREIRKKYPETWVGLYAYSSHRLPPTIDVEPNVCVQVALGFNQTEFTLPELVERWSKKVSAIGLREYYGVEAWDWGLPGRLRGGKTAYHQEWIPFYAERKAVSYNAETNANWAAQMLGLDVAAELMWNTKADVNALKERYFAECFGTAASVMKGFQAKLEGGGPLQPAMLLPLFEDIEKARGMTTDPRVQARLTDLMAYLVYVDMFRSFQLVESSQPTRNEKYYDALKPLMIYTWRTRERDMVHHYALARRFCNGAPVQDKRLDFYIARKDAPPVWRTGETLTDSEIRDLFGKHLTSIKADTNRFISYTRTFQVVRPEGPDAGPSRRSADTKDVGAAAFRMTTRGFVVAADQQEIAVAIEPVKKPVTFRIAGPRDEELLKETIAKGEQPTTVKFKFPKAGEYRFQVEGEAILRVKPGTPLVYEASAEYPAWVDYSGPHYFYVPRGVKQIVVDTVGHLTLFAPGQGKRVDVTKSSRSPGQGYTLVDVPEGADGKVWHTDANTRGAFQFLNVPPFLSLSREKIFVPREVAETDGLTTAK